MSGITAELIGGGGNDNHNTPQQAGSTAAATICRLLDKNDVMGFYKQKQQAIAHGKQSFAAMVESTESPLSAPTTKTPASSTSSGADDKGAAGGGSSKGDISGRCEAASQDLLRCYQERAGSATASSDTNNVSAAAEDGSLGGIHLCGEVARRYSQCAESNMHEFAGAMREWLQMRRKFAASNS